MDNRVQRLRHALEKHELDGALISNPQNRRYLSGFTGSAGYLLVTPADAIIATDFRYYEQSAAQAPDFRLHKTVGGFDAWAPPLFAGLGGKKIAFEAGDMTGGDAPATEEVARDVAEAERPQLVPTPNLVESLRLFKEPGEIVCAAGGRGSWRRRVRGRRAARRARMDREAGGLGDREIHPRAWRRRAIVRHDRRPVAPGARCRTPTRAIGSSRRARAS